MTPEQSQQVFTWVISGLVLVLFGIVLADDVRNYFSPRPIGASRLRAVIKSLVLVASLLSIFATSTLATFGPEDAETRRWLGLMTRAVVTGSLLVGGIALVASVFVDRRRGRHDR